MWERPKFCKELTPWGSNKPLQQQRAGKLARDLLTHFRTNKQTNKQKEE